MSVLEQKVNTDARIAGLDAHSGRVVSVEAASVPILVCPGAFVGYAVACFAVGYAVSKS